MCVCTTGHGRHYGSAVPAAAVISGTTWRRGLGRAARTRAADKRTLHAQRHERLHRLAVPPTRDACKLGLLAGRVQPATAGRRSELPGAVAHDGRAL